MFALPLNGDYEKRPSVVFWGPLKPSSKNLEFCGNSDEIGHSIKTDYYKPIKIPVI